MPKYLRLYNQFVNFVKMVEKELTTDYERKLINLILEDFDAIKDKKATKGLRGKHLYELIKKKGKSVSPTITVSSTNTQSGGFSFVGLDSIVVEHFRGFSEKETFKFDRPFTFVFGPNGSGKSSLCEALEFSMLGYIQEAIAKDIDVQEYTTNCFDEKQSDPVLKAKDASGNIIDISQNQDLQFCFIEKSRIESFARISANTPKKMEEQLATLFGLDEFNEFVGDFNKKVDDYFEMDSLKAREYEAKSAGMPGIRENLEGEKKKKGEAEAKIAEIVKNSGIPSVGDFEFAFVSPKTGTKTKLEEMSEKLSAPTSQSLVFPTVIKIVEDIKAAKTALVPLTAIRSQLTSRKKEFQFRDLFEAASVVETLWTESCPLCETPMDEVHKHPYDNARAKLKELETLAAFENQEEKDYEIFLEKIDAMDKSTESFNAVLVSNGKDSFQFDAIPWPGKNRADRDLAIAHHETVEIFTNQRMKELVEAEASLTAINSKIQDEMKAKAVLRAEYERLKIEKDSYIQEKANVKNCDDRIQQAEKTIATFEAETATLKAEVQSEKERIDQNKLWLSAYDSFKEKLDVYKDQLPLRYVQKLSELTCSIYNQLNQHDREYEKALSIDLPKTTADSIKIEFAKNPGSKFDALLVLSEGHLRCLGLSILMAKNIDDNCPVIIFDDVVNAIDDEHRSGVADLLFEFDRLRGKQIILTTHAEHFISDLQLKVPAQNKKDLIHVYNFQSDEKRRKINIDSKSRNHLERADEHYSDGRMDDTLHSCRLALDNIAEALWKRLWKKGYAATIRVPLRELHAKPDTKNAIEALKSFIKTKNVTEFIGTDEHFEYLLQEDVWSQFNIASHEMGGKPTFNNAIIKEIVGRCYKIDAIVKS